MADEDLSGRPSDFHAGLKHKVSKVGGGAFSSIGLNANLTKAIQKKGYKQPTPIQRRCIPPLLAGRDLVGMARTGSGKTAAFVLPILQNLRAHSAKTGVRALILAPSRELALQTLKFTQLMAKFTDLRVAALIGGDSLEEQFAAMASNPDIVVATPGRLLHVCVEASINLKTVSMVVWDEADRLMEDASMGEQLKDIMARCPASRQTALFSATMPQALAEFARMGLNDPALIKLDAESTLSPDLKTIFLAIKNESRDAHLITLLSQHCRAPGSKKKPLTVIFCATKHHVEYLQELLVALNFPCTYIYGALDQQARESAIELFRSGRRSILIVTDVASRGIDVPLLDIAINYDFPATPKLFVHRVGRVARAGRTGTAFSLVAPDEMPHLFDLQLFLGRPVEVATGAPPQGGETILLGALRQDEVDHETERLRNLVAINGTISNLRDVVKNACKLYKKTRVSASPESHRRSKELLNSSVVVGPHPALYAADAAETDGLGMMAALRAFKPKQSFLEMTNKEASRAAPSESKKRKRTQLAEATPESFRDEQNYMAYRPEKRPGSELSFGRIAADAVFDINGTRNKDDLIKVGKMLSSKLKKQVTKKQIKLMKTEYGTSVPASYKAGHYEKWCARTRLAIPKPGEAESTDVSSRAKAIVNEKLGQRKWRTPKGKSGGKPSAAGGEPKFGGRPKPGGKFKSGGRPSAAGGRPSSAGGKPSFRKPAGGKPKFGSKRK